MVPPSKARRSQRKAVRSNQPSFVPAIRPSYARRKVVNSNKNKLSPCPFCGNSYKDLTNHLESGEFTFCTLKQQSLRFSHSGLDINRATATDIVVDYDEDQHEFPIDDYQLSSAEDTDDEEEKEEVEMSDTEIHNTENIPIRRIVDFCNHEIKDEEPIVSKVSSHQYKQSFQPFERVLIRLYDLIESAEAPLTLLDDIMEIIRKETISGHFNILKHTPKRKTFFKNLKKSFHVPKPEAIPFLPESSNDHISYHDKSLHVVRYNFLEQVNDLLEDNEMFGNIKNFQNCLNKNDPFSSRNFELEDDSMLDEVQSGSWFRDTCTDIETNVMRDSQEPYMVIPVSVYFDATGTDAYQRYSLEPCAFQLHLCNRTTRNNPRSKRVLGYVPTLDRKSSAQSSRDRNSSGYVGKGRSVRNWHKAASIILQSFQDAQGFDKRVVGFIRIGDKVKLVRLFFPLAFVCGDAKSQDKVCGRYGSIMTRRSTRSCDVHYFDLDNYRRKCTHLKFSDIEKYNDAALKHHDLLPMDEGPQDANMPTKDEAISKLESLSQHMHINAFCELNMGNNARGIFGATPIDLMHAFQHGVLERMLKVHIELFTVTEKNTFDHIVNDVLCCQPQRQSKLFPRVNFAKGITNLTLITAEEWVGVALAMLILISTDDGDDVYKRMCSRKFKDFSTAEDDDADDINVSLYPGEPFNPSIHKFRAVGEKAIEEDLEFNNDGDLNDDRELAPEKPCGRNTFIMILETALGMYAWFHRGFPIKDYDSTHREALDLAIRKWLAYVKTYVPRTKGSGWRLQKFHDMLHVAEEISRWGSPMNFDCGIWESFLKIVAKRPSQSSQKIAYQTFIEQVNSRLVESAVLRKAMRFLPYQSKASSLTNTFAKQLLQEEKNYVSSKTYVTEFPFTSIYTVNNQSAYIATISGVIRRERPFLDGQCTDIITNVPYALQEWFTNAFSDDTTDLFQCTSPIEVFSAYTKDRYLYRAHPFFYSRSHYCWCMARFENVIAQDDLIFYDKNEFPCKILCFYLHPDTHKKMAIVHCATEPVYDRITCILEKWKMEYTHHAWTPRTPNTTSERIYKPTLRSIPVESIIQPVFVTDEHPHLRGTETGPANSPHRLHAIVIKPLKAWGGYFL